MHQINILQVTQEVGYLQNIAEEESKRNEFVLQYLKPLLHSGLGKILKGFHPIVIKFLVRNFRNKYNKGLGKK